MLAANAHAACMVGFGDCDPATDELGYRTAAANAQAFAADKIYCFLDTPECSGMPTTAYLYHGGTTDGQVAKLAFYKDTDEDGEPDSGDDLVATSNALSSTGVDNDWDDATMASAARVTTVSNYFVCLVVGPDAVWDGVYGTTSAPTLYYRTCTGCYSSVPANLDGTWSEYTGRKISGYVTLD